MKTGKLINIGVGRPSGTIRKLTITDQLGQALLSPIGTDINHPVHGRLSVPQSTAIILLNSYSERQLIRLKKELFTNNK